MSQVVKQELSSEVPFMAIQHCKREDVLAKAILNAKNLEELISVYTGEKDLIGEVDKSLVGVKNSEGGAISLIEVQHQNLQLVVEHTEILIRKLKSIF